MIFLPPYLHIDIQYLQAFNDIPYTVSEACTIGVPYMKTITSDRVFRNDKLIRPNIHSKPFRPPMLLLITDSHIYQEYSTKILCYFVL